MSHPVVSLLPPAPDGPARRFTGPSLSSSTVRWPARRRRRGGRRPQDLTGTELAALSVHSLAGLVFAAASWACGEPSLGLAIVSLVGGPALVRSYF